MKNFIQSIALFTAFTAVYTAPVSAAPALQPVAVSACPAGIKATQSETTRCDYTYGTTTLSIQAESECSSYEYNSDGTAATAHTIQCNVRYQATVRGNAGGLLTCPKENYFIRSDCPVATSTGNSWGSSIGGDGPCPTEAARRMICREAFENNLAAQPSLQEFYVPPAPVPPANASAVSSCCDSVARFHQCALLNTSGCGPNGGQVSSTPAFNSNGQYLGCILGCQDGSCASITPPDLTELGCRGPAGPPRKIQPNIGLQGDGIPGGEPM